MIALALNAISRARAAHDFLIDALEDTCNVVGPERPIPARCEWGAAIVGRYVTPADFWVCDILDGVEGLVHISELAQHHVENPREIIQPGDPVRVKILEIDSERRRLSLSIKRVEGQVLPVRPIEPPPEGAGSLDDVPELGLSEDVFAPGEPVDDVAEPVDPAAESVAAPDEPVDVAAEPAEAATAESVPPESEADEDTTETAPVEAPEAAADPGPESPDAPAA